MIAISHLEFAYPRGGFRLRVPQLDIAGGVKAAIVGPSGSGKTTLLNLIAGILVPSAGRIVAAGVEVTALSDAARRDFRARRLGLVFQEFELIEHLHVLDNILLPYRLSPALQLDRSRRERAEQLARALGLDDKLRRQIRQLSQGERQRVAVCRALLPEPAILLCDEPTGNLDRANRELVLDALERSAAETGATLLAVSHDAAILPRFETVIDAGRYCGESEGVP